MQTVAARTAQRAAVAKRPAAVQRSAFTRGAVSCKASLKPQELAKKAAALATAVPALVAANPAFALVDDRLNGDGVGYPLGISDPTVGWVIVGVASAVWIAYFIAQRDFGDFEDDDTGLSL